jgi:D-arabinose 1-dehydrogenase-like Zn-dependent alcohol dehydrogenase
MCAGLTAFNGLRQAEVTATARVAVIGTLALQYAVAMGARGAVIARSPEAASRARDLGAELFVASGDTDPATALKGWDGGANVILNAVPSNAAATAVFTGLAPDGTLVLCGYDTRRSPCRPNRWCSTACASWPRRPAHPMTYATLSPSPPATTSCRRSPPSPSPRPPPPWKR